MAILFSFPLPEMPVWPEEDGKIVTGHAAEAEADTPVSSARAHINTLNCLVLRTAKTAPPKKNRRRRLTRLQGCVFAG